MNPRLSFSPRSLPRNGSSLLEVVICLALLGPILAGVSLVCGIGERYFARAQAAQLYHLHVEPLEILMAKQIRNCRVAIYTTLEDARGQNPLAVTEVGNILRADRMDGNGWFILQWDNPNHALNLVTDGGPGIPFTRSIRLENGSTNLFDLSQGPLLVFCCLPIPVALLSLYGNSASEVDYVLTAERQQ